MLKWGVVATVRAETDDILKFAAYHLEAGAHRVYLYLDDPDQPAIPELSAHPKIRLRICDRDYWTKSETGRPKKHQVRQTYNATHAYRRTDDVEWLAHIDVDEFLVPLERSLEQVLGDIPADAMTVRCRPMECLAGADRTAYKAFVPSHADRTAITQSLYPEFGAFLKAGFISHLAGKVFMRTGQTNVTFKIHRVFQGGAALPDDHVSEDLSLAHIHAKDWADWRGRYTFRIESGSYRAPPDAENEDSLYARLRKLEETEGEAGLRRFYDEVVADTPELRARLGQFGLLRRVDLNLDALKHRHF